MTSEYSLPEQPSTSSLPNNSDNYSNKIGSWLRSCLELAESSSNQVIISKLQKLDTYWRLPSFRLAVVGELNRGKSTLINRLLGRSILPAYNYPTTGTITSIIAGSEEHMELCFTDGKRKTRLLEESSWDDLLATNQAGDDRELPVPEVQVTVNNSWLEAIDIELIDTPAAENISSHRTALLSKLLGQCDATVLVVSADMPFSTTEAAFLEEEVVGQHIPRILVVVSKLDNIPQENRNRLLTTIKQRVAKVSDKVSVLPLHPINSVMTQDEVFKAVQTKIEDLVGRENRRGWRSQRIALQTTDCLSQLMEIGEETITALAMNAAERKKALQKINLEVGEANLGWGNIKLELDKRRMQHSQKLQKEIDAAKAEFLNYFLNELNKKEDVKSWWEDTLPISLRSLIVILDRKTEKFIISNLNRDSEWLQIQVERVFDVKMPNQSVNSLEEPEIPLDLKQIKFDDTKLQVFWGKASSLTPRVIEILGAGLFAPALWATNPPLAITIAALSLALGEGSGMILNFPSQKIVKEQRKLVAIELEKALEKIFSLYSNSIDENFRQLYEQLIEKTKEKQNIWILTRKSSLNNNDNYEPEKIMWKQIINDASTLRKDIVTVVKNSID